MHIVRNNRLEEVPDDEDFDFELTSPARQFGSHTNSIPLQSAVQAPRLFYGGRFANQTFSVDKGEAPLVQNLDPEDPDGRSFDEKLGEKLGALRARAPGKVVSVTPDRIRVAFDDGSREDLDLYDNFFYNQKSGIFSRPLVKPGDRFEAGQVLSASNFTDDSGTANMGMNARIGLVPWKGFSMDDAIPISESFAKRLSAVQFKVMKQDRSENLKTGLGHFRALFPSKYSKELLSNFDEDGLVKPGTIVNPGDPVLLATMPRTMSSAGANVGKLSRALRQNRRDASQVWEGHQPAKVVDARKTKNGMKVVLKYVKPTEEGDKIVLRQGGKATVSRIIPDDQMPRTEDGRPLDVLLNPLSLVSRANPASQHEIRLGKIARKIGAPIKVPAYLPPGQDWNSYIAALEEEHGVSSKERVFDPETGRFLSAPVTVGEAFINRLHHTAEGKGSYRGVGSYDLNEQPSRGSGEMARAKRYSGLENAATLSSGAYALMRENSTIRGQRSDQYWRDLRAGRSLPNPEVPFVWNKFRALLSGAGINTRDVGQGRIRLAPFTDEDLDAQNPVDVDSGDLVDLAKMQPIKGGLFDDRIVAGEKWGRIRLPRPIINPAMEDSVRVLLGLTKKQLEDVLAGRLDLSEAMGK